MDEAPDRYFEKQKWRAIDEDEYLPHGGAEEEGEGEKDDDDDDESIGDEEEFGVAQEEEEIEHRLYRDLWVKKRGAMTEQERSRCRELGLDVIGQVETLAKELQRSTRSVLLEAGIITQKARGPSLSNMYRAWLAKNEPKTKEGLYVYPRPGASLKLPCS